MFSAEEAAKLLTEAGLPACLMIDASPANSRKIPARQIHVAHDIATQIARGNRDIFGIMLESHLVEGNQKVVEGQPLTYGQSITDTCIGWEDTEVVLKDLAAASRKRRT